MAFAKSGDLGKDEAWSFSHRAGSLLLRIYLIMNPCLPAGSSVLLGHGNCEILLHSVLKAAACAGEEKGVIHLEHS
jgi:hypothetical protein